MYYNQQVMDTFHDWEHDADMMMRNKIQELMHNIREHGNMATIYALGNTDSISSGMALVLYLQRYGMAVKLCVPGVMSKWMKHLADVIGIEMERHMNITAEVYNIAIGNQIRTLTANGECVLNAVVNYVTDMVFNDERCHDVLVISVPQGTTISEMLVPIFSVEADFTVAEATALMFGMHNRDLDL